MRLCIVIEGQEGVTWQDWEALADACDVSGLDGLFRSDHYQSVQGDPGRDCLDAWATLAGLAARTRKIRLGTLVSPVTFRHPALLAKMVATVDHISSGRVEVGLGAGWYEHEHRAFGFSFPSVRARLDLLDDQLEFLNRVWTDTPLTFAGHHLVVQHCLNFPAPVQKPHPPLIVGGRGGQRSIATAVRYASEYNAYEVDVGECRQRRSALEAACELAGRDPSTLVLSVAIPCVVGNRKKEVERRLEAALARIPVGGDPVAATNRDISKWIVGTPREVVDQLGAFEDAGVERVFLRHWDHADTDMIRLISADVLSALN